MRLKVQLDQANERADAAQAALQQRVDTETVYLAGTVEELQQANEKLKTERDDARSHIFSLQPYMKDLTPEEVGRVRTPLTVYRRRARLINSAGL
jgi:hypothetical protein